MQSIAALIVLCCATLVRVGAIKCYTSTKVNGTYVRSAQPEEPTQQPSWLKYISDWNADGTITPATGGCVVYVNGMSRHAEFLMRGDDPKTVMCLRRDAETERPISCYCMTDGCNAQFPADAERYTAPLINCTSAWGTSYKCGTQRQEGNMCSTTTRFDTPGKILVDASHGSRCIHAMSTTGCQVIRDGYTLRCVTANTMHIQPGRKDFRDPNTY